MSKKKSDKPVPMTRPDGEPAMVSPSSVERMKGKGYKLGYKAPEEKSE